MATIKSDYRGNRLTARTLNRDAAPSRAAVMFKDVNLKTVTSYLAATPTGYRFHVTGIYVVTVSCTGSLTTGATIDIKEVTSAPADVQTLFASAALSTSKETAKEFESLTPAQTLVLTSGNRIKLNVSVACDATTQVADILIVGFLI